MASEQSTPNSTMRWRRSISPGIHLAPTYAKSQITPLKNNYNGATPDPDYIPEWRLTLVWLSPV